MSVIFSCCVECEHLIKKEDPKDLCCEAFPNGIPNDKLFHTDEQEICNNGIKYEHEAN